MSFDIVLLHAQLSTFLQSYSVPGPIPNQDVNVWAHGCVVLWSVSLWGYWMFEIVLLLTLVWLAQRYTGCDFNVHGGVFGMQLGDQGVSHELYFCPLANDIQTWFSLVA